MAEQQRARIVHKHDIEANWLKAVNFTPLQGEIIVYDIEYDSSGAPLSLEGTGRKWYYAHERFKIGDGKTKVSDLPFVASVGRPSVDDDKITGGEIFNDYINNEAKGAFAHAEGSFTFARGDFSHAGGYKTIAGKEIETVEQEKTLITSIKIVSGGSNSTLLPDNTIAGGNDAFLTGSGVKVGDKISFKLISINPSYPDQETIEETVTAVVGEYIALNGSYIIFKDAEALEYSHEAYIRRATYTYTGDVSFAHGTGLKATVDNQVVFGAYNAEDNEALFIIGNGTESVSSNAFTLKKDSAYIGNDLIVTMNDSMFATLADLESELAK